MKMTDEEFYICLEYWKESTGNKSFWGELADRFGYESVESIRSAFKRKRTALGIEKESARTMQQKPVIGVVDLETLPIKIAGYVFGIRDQYLSYDMVAQDSHMLSWAGKFYGDNRIFSDIMTPEEALNYDSFRIAQSLREFISSCHFVIGHNWQGFDRKVLNSELIYHSIAPVQYKTIDTYLLIRSNFKEASYKLKDINRKWGIRNKVSHEGFNLWKRCAAGEQSALDEMLFYNEGDILATEELFTKIQPYVSESLPSLSVFEKKVNVCFCGRKKFVKDGFIPTKSGMYDRLVCKCGAIYHGKKNLLTKERKESLLVG